LSENPLITTKNIQEKIDQLESATKPIMDELHRKRQEKQRAEEKRKKAEEEEKKKQEQAQQTAETAGDQPSPGAPEGQSAQPMDVDPAHATTN
jgi:uncharacterized membrane protein YukC